MNAELWKKLRRRTSLGEYSAIAKRDLERSEWAFDLNELGNFAPREDVISFKYVYHPVVGDDIVAYFM